MTGFTGFTGGMLAPLLIGDKPLPFNNDFIVAFVVVSWYSTFYLGGDKVWSHPIPKGILSVFLALFRTHSCINMLMRANSVMSPNKYESVAIFGPIFISTFMGCAGMFFPQKGDGFASLDKDTPWALQGGFITSTLTHLMINDHSGFLGKSLRALIGTHSLDTMKMLFGTMHIVTIFTQTFVSPDSSLFEQFHNVFYLVTGVTGPQTEKANSRKTFSYEAVMKTEHIMEYVSHFLIVFLSMAIFCYTVPPSVLSPGNSHFISANGTGIGVCQMFSTLRACTPYRLSLKVSESSLAFETETWSIKLPILEDLAHRSRKYDFGVVRAYLDTSGTVRIVSSSDSEQEKELWSSGSKCKTYSKNVYLTLDKNNGKPVIVCGDNSKVVL